MTSSRDGRSTETGSVASIAGGVAVVVLLTSLPALAQNPYKLKPGARGEICLDCHDTFRETIALPHVHTPVKAGDCADCHDPHASSHGKLLAEEASGICTQCHEGLVDENPVSVHAAVVEGNCNNCHDPHASEHAKNLIRAGNDLCKGCHVDVAKSAEARFSHAPVRDDCLSCHDPHGSSTADFLLAKAEPELCVDCHDTTGSAFRDRHMQYPVERGRCTSCHNPHGSDQGAILRANAHQPVVGRMCAQCHGDPAAPDALATKREGVDLCRGCHNNEVNAMFASKRVHWPVADRKGCLNCHNPHASDHTGLLAGPPGELCASCHTDTVARGERSEVTHAPVADGVCSTCHAPHGSDNPFLFEMAGTDDLCGSCHDWQQHSTHPIGEEVIDQRNPNLSVDCASCHRTHGTDHEYLANFESKRDLCVNCHETFRR